MLGILDHIHFLWLCSYLIDGLAEEFRVCAVTYNHQNWSWGNLWLLQPMYEAINETEAIVFSSLIYYYQITGQTKVWLETSASVSTDFHQQKISINVTYCCPPCISRSSRLPSTGTRGRLILATWMCSRQKICSSSGFT
jgi:hypothetical protein